MKRIRFSVILALGLGSLLLWTSRPARAQTNLGDQRVATSSGTFLKIGLDARAAALANAANALVTGPGAVFTNPAAILATQGSNSVYMSYIQWPADIQIGGASLSKSLPALSAQLAAGVEYLSTDLEETNEFYPLGTGRTLTYSDFLGVLSFSRFFTERLTIGVSLKYFREDLGSNLGGPLTAGWLFDAGTMYALGYRNAKLAITLANFGPDLKPAGAFNSHVTGGPVQYTAFSPPTQFQLGFAMDPWIGASNRLTAVAQIEHQADKKETFRGGLEYWLKDHFALRGGYDLSSDEMNLSAGLGFKLALAGRPSTVDYAFTQGGHLADVHRWSLSFGL